MGSIQSDSLTVPSYLSASHDLQREARLPNSKEEARYPRGPSFLVSTCVLNSSYFSPHPHIASTAPDYDPKPIYTSSARLEVSSQQAYCSHTRKDNMQTENSHLFGDLDPSFQPLWMADRPAWGSKLPNAFQVFKESFPTNTATEELVERTFQKTLLVKAVWDDRQTLFETNGLNAHYPIHRNTADLLLDSGLQVRAWLKEETVDRMIGVGEDGKVGDDQVAPAIAALSTFAGCRLYVAAGVPRSLVTEFQHRRHFVPLTPLHERYLDFPLLQSSFQTFIGALLRSQHALLVSMRRPPQATVGAVISHTPSEPVAVQQAVGRGRSGKINKLTIDWDVGVDVDKVSKERIWHERADYGSRRGRKGGRRT
ncbi:hypothetical protein BJ508DRAFT_323447 [Ascobolus immersus RN42]|uniref:Uncharacterized protein n=1 Tax=Ascobolus immersus RN42 TaxID=1160509 RepID=A0A3N4IEG0_ASCIM|nr:hypothetical protein BJ508DRAFT_323447 [Ascobolus immersus RN42]